MQTRAPGERVAVHLIPRAGRFTAPSRSSLLRGLTRAGTLSEAAGNEWVHALKCELHHNSDRVLVGK